MSDRKRELLDAAIRDLLVHGVADVSLRPLAARIGSSARLLIFHFKSKHGLLNEVLAEVQARLQATALALPPAAAAGGTAPLKTFWRWATHKDNLPYLRLLYEVHFIALQNPRVYGRYLKQTSISWVQIIEQRLSPALRSKAIATLCGAVFDGLIIELLGTGDLRRTTRALDEFIAILTRESASRRDPP
jgi:AcrR family transcriptional regulator